MADPIWPWKPEQLEAIEVFDDAGERIIRLVPGETAEGKPRRFEISFDENRRVLRIQ